MGDPKKTKKHYVPPRKPWDKTRLDEEKKIVETYGLKNKRELWAIETFLRNKRENARKLLALALEERLKREKELLDSLARIGLLTQNAILDDVLSLNAEALCERRLQTLAWRKGLANTVTQARQFITHGHVAIAGKKVTVPSYIVPAGLENKISYYGKEMQLKQEEKPKKKELQEAFEESKPKAEFIEEESSTLEEMPEKSEKPKEKKEKAAKKGKEKGQRREMGKKGQGKKARGEK